LHKRRREGSRAEAAHRGTKKREAKAKQAETIEGKEKKIQTKTQCRRRR
jgi:hypothetical protein